MAIKIPRILPSARTITPQTPARTIRKSGVSGEVTESIGQTISEIGDKIRNANAVAEKTRAQNQFDSDIFGIQSRASVDPDFSEERQRFYDEEIRRAQSEASKQISIPSEKSQFQLESQSKANVSRIKVRGSFQKKAIEQGKIDLEKYISNKEIEFVNSQNFQEKQTAILERDSKINEAAAAGYLTKKEASDQIKLLNKQWKQSQLDHDISSNPALARENIVAGNYNLTAKEEKTALTLATDLEKKRNAEEQRISEADMRQSEIDLYNAVVGGGAPLREINDAEAKGSLGLKGGIRENVAADLRRLVTKGNTATPEQKANSFVELQDRFTDIQYEPEISLDDLAQFRSDVVASMSKGEIRNTVGEKWLKDTSEILDDELRAEVEKRNPRSGWGILKFWVDGLDVEEKQQMKEKLGQELMDRVNNGDNETEAANEIILKEQKNFNPNAGKYKKDDMVKNSNGSWRVVGHETMGDGEPLVVRV